MAKPPGKLSIGIDGKIIDHLGLKMYQSPVAAIAEIVSNTWDADASKVKIVLPSTLSKNAEITVTDNGIGMTFEECRDKYLSVGRCRRENPDDRSPGGRPLLGRKGIGKFAGFGIADVIYIETISKKNGERTLFEMNVEKIRCEGFQKPIPVIAYDPPDVKRKKQHGTVVTLQGLHFTSTPSEQVFKKSMARRFTLLRRAENFVVLVNGEPVPDSGDFNDVQFDFPKDYDGEDVPEGLTIEDNWGKETLSNGKEVRWRIAFYKAPISEEELRGVSIFSHGKLCQSPFFFNLEGGMAGQLAQTYMTGRVEADFIDEMDDDLIATERQRLDWKHPDSKLLLQWGRGRVKELQKIWQKKRVAIRNKSIDERVLTFSKRLGKLAPREGKVVSGVIRKVASVATITDEQLEEYGDAILTAWEGGALKGVLEEIINLKEIPAEALRDILKETDILTTLSMGQSVRGKLDVIIGLSERIEREEYENDLRDYLADYSWLLGKEWELFIKEKGINKILEKAADKVKLDELDGFKGRIDLVLTDRKEGPRRFLILELMRPGVSADMDHLDRFDRYITHVQAGLEANSLVDADSDIAGFLIADNLDEQERAFVVKQRDMKRKNLLTMDWATLLQQSIGQWQEFMDKLLQDAPDDPRIRSLTKRLGRGS